MVKPPKIQKAPASVTAATIGTAIGPTETESAHGVRDTEAVSVVQIQTAQMTQRYTQADRSERPGSKPAVLMSTAALMTGVTVM